MLSLVGITNVYHIKDKQMEKIETSMVHQKKERLAQRRNGQQGYITTERGWVVVVNVIVGRVAFGRIDVLVKQADHSTTERWVAMESVTFS
jgi:hypothetical protein